MAKFILPGLIDPHVHLRDPGQTQKEDFYSGTCAAIAGGFTTILDMPNNKIPITTKDRLNDKIKKAKEKIVCDVGFYFGSLGDNFNEFEKVKDRIYGVKLYLNQTTGNYLIDENKIFEIFEKIPSSLLILVHAEEKSVEDVLKVVRKIKKRTHFCHISTEFELKQILKAKEEGLAITCGVTPHHLFLSEDDIQLLGSFGKMKPLLKSKKDIEFIWKHLIGGSIDIIESDHAPHTILEKEGNESPFGVPGLETALPLMLTAVSQKRLTIDRLIELCYENPSKIFNIKQDQNTQIEIDQNYSYTIKNENLFSKSKWTPFDGWQVKGKVIKAFIRGTKVFEDGEILAKPGFGRVLKNTV